MYILKPTLQLNLLKDYSTKEGQKTKYKKSKTKLAQFPCEWWCFTVPETGELIH